MPAQSLDLSFNHLCELGPALEALAELPKLQLLSLAGNPVALLPRFRSRVLAALPRLQALDDVAVAGGDEPEQSNDADTAEAKQRAEKEEAERAAAEDEPGTVRIAVRLGSLTGVLPTPPPPAAYPPAEEKAGEDVEGGGAEGGDDGASETPAAPARRQESHFIVASVQAGRAS